VAVTYRCMVVDDEPLARRVIARHIATLPWLELAAECGSAEAAATYLHEHSIDVMFLDIKMPGLSGLDFLETLRNPPQVILTTAYPEYALTGYEYSVVDYLLKPISLERFPKAVNKLGASSGSEKKTPERASSRNADDFIFLRADRTDHKVHLLEIRYVEGYGNFVKVHLDRGTLLVAKTLTAVEEALPKDLFLRVHRSFIVSLDRIVEISKTSLHIEDVEIPVGRSYRRHVAQVVTRRR
jgi:DNA-binding LytR/AlgR family response regulator